MFIYSMKKALESKDLSYTQASSLDCTLGREKIVRHHSSNNFMLTGEVSNFTTITFRNEFK